MLRKVLFGAVVAVGCGGPEASPYFDQPARGGGMGGTSAHAGAGGAASSGGSLGGSSSVGGSSGTAGRGDPRTAGASGGGASGTGGSAGGLGGGSGAGAASDAGGTESGGNAGDPGTAGSENAGTGGAVAGASGASGGAGAADGGSDDSCPSGAEGCAKLLVPFGASGERTLCRIDLGGEFDFSNAVVTFRVFAVGTGGSIAAYVQHGGDPDYNWIYGGVNDLVALDGWTTLTWTVSATDPGFTFDKTVIRRLGIVLLASDPGPWANPTVVYIDSIAVTYPDHAPFSFDDATTVSSASTSPPTDVLWLSTNEGDYVPGSTLSWVGP